MQTQMPELKQRSLQYGHIFHHRLQYAHIFHQTSNYVLKCEVRKLWYLVVLKFSILITKIYEMLEIQKYVQRIHVICLNLFM